MKGTPFYLVAAIAFVGGALHQSHGLPWSVSVSDTATPAQMANELIASVEIIGAMILIGIGTILNRLPEEKP